MKPLTFVSYYRWEVPQGLAYGKLSSFFPVCNLICKLILQNDSSTSVNLGVHYEHCDITAITLPMPTSREIYSQSSQKMWEVTNKKDPYTRLEHLASAENKDTLYCTSATKCYSGTPGSHSYCDLASSLALQGLVALILEHRMQYWWLDENYSRTPLFWTSEMRTPHFNRRFA